MKVAQLGLTKEGSLLHAWLGQIGFDPLLGPRMSTTSTEVPQAAAIPVHNGKVCLVTSRNGKRWVVPKGCLEPGKTAGEIALQEAWEEAGLVGHLQPEPVGSYRYDKGGLTCHVLVYVLQVTEVFEHWPEETFRERCWLTPTQAVARIEEPSLRELLRAALLNRAG
jgi:8-oxo-dGTP pyrophosphatase MutT (NUDIX family)